MIEKKYYLIRKKLKFREAKRKLFRKKKSLKYKKYNYLLRFSFKVPLKRGI